MDDVIVNFLKDYNDEMKSFYSEKQRRLSAAKLALGLGRGGKTYVHNITGLSYESIRNGIDELSFLECARQSDDACLFEIKVEIDRLSNPQKSRRAGGGRKRATETYPELKEHINSIIYECSYGDPMTNHMWTNASLDFIREVLIHDWDIYISKPTISNIVKELGYSLQGNKKMEQVGKPHPDRDKQFKFINKKVESFLSSKNAVISVDTKKKEYIQNSANKGTEYRKAGDPRAVLDHDFHAIDGTRIIPYGIYVLNSNHGYVNIGTSYDTAQFAVASIRKWWESEGIAEFADSSKLLILCDCGGSNACRSRLFKWELGKFARDHSLEVHISHYPPGTSKWNKVEHRLFSPISRNWAAKPLVSIEVAKGYICGTKTKTGLYVHADVDTNEYSSGIKISDKELKRILLVRCETCPSWNYIIKGINLEGYTGTH